jgi:hypothetical protein
MKETEVMLLQALSTIFFGIPVLALGSEAKYKK